MKHHAPAILVIGIIAVIAACGASREASSSARIVETDPPAIVDTGAWNIRGYALGMHAGDDEYDYGPALREIRDQGANAVELDVPYFQDDVHSSDPGPRANRTPTLAQVREAIQGARRIGMRVYILPIVLLERAEPKEWRGTMKPDDPDLWWRSYGELVLDLAMVAESSGAEGLLVGSELVWSERQRSRWARLISDVRVVYRGRVSYSANWDHYKPVSFWDLTDAIAVSGYFELTGRNDADQEELDAAWLALRREIAEFSSKKKKTVFFSEFGYPALDGGAVFPWDYTMESESDSVEQAMAVRAFISAWRGHPGFGGGFYYEWGLPGQPPPKYSPRGLPAERLLRDWFGGG